MALADRTVNELIQALCMPLFQSSSLDIYTDLATEETSSSFFGKFYNYAIALRASHYYTIDVLRANGDSGLVTAKQEGRLQVSFLHNMKRASSSDLGMTQFGQRLQSLIHSRGPIASVSVTDFDLDADVSLQISGEFY
jgi:hypothetical protein